MELTRKLVLAVLIGLAVGATAAVLQVIWQVRADREFMGYVYGPEGVTGGPAAADVAALLEEARRITREAL